MNSEQALHELGVRDDTLTAEQKTHLDQDGYLIIENVLSPEQVTAYRDVLDTISAQEGEAAGTEQHREEGADRVADLVNKHPLFDAPYIEPRILAAAAHTLGNDLKLFTFSSRAALPGQGYQVLHKDGFVQPEQPGEYHILNTIWLLDDFTPENGATRIVPGSHLTPGTPSEVTADPMAAHPDEIKVTAKAGSVVIFNSHMLHGGTLNTTDSPRRAMFVSYCIRDMNQLIDERKFFRPETRARISEAARVVLDVD